MTLYGHFFRSGCNDTGNCVDEERPLPPVTLLVTYPGGGTEELGPLTPAGWDSGFRTELTIPAGTPPGRIRVRYDGQPRPQRPFVLVVGAA
ncbi:hypothetical protein GRQ65_19630 [Nocardioides sp. YIM 123512]|uniref:Uncharacterized protein n=1 Tax=Nocardioides flavescens TaxID=2691959 RepID=A0A6L7F3F0_9ACTN|nr:hypothetical protein [Nocardioides flavescens]